MRKDCAFVKLMFSIVVLLLTANTCFGTVYVKKDSPIDGPGNDWEHAFHSIQAGIDAAAATSDTVWVAAGSYSERITLTTSVALQGGYSGVGSERDIAAYTTTINGTNSGATVTGASGASIDGFTVTNGSPGILFQGRSFPTINSCTLSSNTTGVRLDGCTTPTITGSTFTGNTGDAALATGNTGGVFTITGNIASGNYTNGLRLDCSLTADTQFKASGSFPYVITNALSPQERSSQ